MATEQQTLQDVLNVGIVKQWLEEVDGCCLDNAPERQDVARHIVRKVAPILNTLDAQKAQLLAALETLYEQCESVWGYPFTGRPRQPVEHRRPLREVGHQVQEALAAARAQ